jgi:membrane protein
MHYLKNIFELIRKTVAGYGRDNGSLLAASLAYYTIFAIAPLLVIAVAVAGLVFGDAAVSRQIEPAISETVGKEAAAMVQNLVANVSESDTGTLGTVLGSLLLLYAASGLFNQLRRALNIIWGIAPAPDQGVWGMLKKRALTFLMVLVIGFLLLFALLASTLVSALDEFLIAQLPLIGPLLPSLDFLVSLALLILLFAIIFRILPDGHVAWRDVFFGAVVTAVLFSIGKYLISLYIRQGAAASTVGAAGSLVILLLWVYYSAQIVLLGAEFTQVYANRFGSGVLPPENGLIIAREPYRADLPPTAHAEEVEEPVYKVTGLVTRNSDHGPQLLLFQHPSAGIQLPAGSVVVGEEAETAVLREVTEETGLTHLKIKQHLGRWENELAEDECIIATTAHALLEPDSQSLPYQTPFQRGLTVQFDGWVNGFAKVAYLEYDQFPDPSQITFSITGYLPPDAVKMRKVRDFFHLTCDEETAVRWTHPGDQDHTFTPFWVPLQPMPQLVPGQDKWLEFVYDKLIASCQP